MIKVVCAKLHGIAVTGAELDYHGSITLDPDQCKRVGILPLEFVDIWNKSSGARLSTYVIYGEPGSRCCVLNGAAARTCQKGDRVIICASRYIQQDTDLYTLKPRVLTFGADNEVTEVLRYDVQESTSRRFEFSVHCEARTNETGRRLVNVDFAALAKDLKARGLSDLVVADMLAKHMGYPS
ncbi:aspartate alpha-decarboxylase [Cupriavidus basilensis OR16]|uniref:Aspartate 1-decarboxylase n=1 Tax=Cupriavidus basilensis OR16 TaxID=1127483 RepID=H1RY14_9BURK|nr:aspartate 1-decarboxylase [Cupriavidus basilensis]EHP44787.1 aspartate alpha-decarboxylase [Cupriavidus basilensis OR16]